MQTMRQRIESGFQQMGRLIYRNHWKVLLLMLALVAGLASQLPKLTLDTSTEGFLHESDPTLLAYNAFREQFGRDELILIAITAPDVFDRAFLDTLKRLHDELRDNTPYLDDITSLINARSTRGAEGELIVEDLLEHWPEDTNALAAVKARAMSNPTYRNMLLSEDGKITTIVIKTEAYTGGLAGADVMSGFDEPAAGAKPAGKLKPLTDAQNSEVVKAVSDITRKYNAEGFRIQLAGSPIVTDVLKRAIQQNMKRFMGMAVLTIALILFVMFRRVSGVLLPMLTVILSLLSTLGLMALTGVPFKLPTQIMPSFLLAVGVGASVHLLAVFYHQLQKLQADNPAGLGPVELKQQAIVYALGHSGLAIMMTSLTTAAGLASFAGAQVAPVSDLGIIAAIGVLLALIYTLVLIPALLSITPIKAKKSRSAAVRTARMDRLLIGIADIATGHPWRVLALSAVLLAVGLAGAVQVHFSHKPYEWLPRSEPARLATEYMNQNMRGASNIEVVVDTGKVNGFYEPAVMQGMDDLSREVGAIDQGELYVGKTLSLSDILKEINQALNENRADHYRIPTDRQLIAQEFLLFENSGSDDLEDFVDSQFSKARMTIKMPWVDAVLYNDFIRDLKQRFHNTLGDGVDITVTGMVALLGRTMHATIVSMANSYLIAVVIITLMMIVLIGDVRIGLVSMIPNVTPIVLTLGLMGWLGLPLDLFTMLIGSIAIGLAVDDTIHFMHNYRRYHHDTGDVPEAVRRTLLSTGRAMFTTSVVLSIGFFLYMFANLSNLVNFGLLTGFTIITALLADFFMAPALMAVMHQRHLIGDDSDY